MSSAADTGSGSRPFAFTAAALLATSLIGRLPQAMGALALVRLALDSSGSYGFAGTLTAAFILASTVGLPMTSRLVDVTSRPVVVLLVSATVSSAALLVVAATVADLPWLCVVCSAVGGFAMPSLAPVLRSIWPTLVGGGARLTRVFAFDAAAQEVLFISGPLVTAACIAAGGGAGAVIGMAASGLVGTAAFCALSDARRQRPATTGARRQSALRTPSVRVLVALQAMTGLPIGVLTITATRAAAGHAAPSLSGVALAVNAGGALVGAVVLARLRPAWSPVRLLMLLLVTLALLYVPTAFIALPVPLWLLTVFLSGVCLAPALTQVYRLLERTAPSAVVTEANAWVVSALELGIGAGTFIAGAAVDSAGDAGLVLSVTLASVSVMVGALLTRRPSLQVTA